MAEGGSSSILPTQDQETPRELDYVVRRMECKEIPRALEVWTETGLVEGTHSIETWYGVDPHGFYVAVDTNGTFLGVCAGIILRPGLAFIGLYAVRSAYRGKGVGKKIWSAVMEHVAGRNVGLNSVPEHLHTYRDLAGFGVVAPWSSVIYEGENVQEAQLADKAQIDGEEVSLSLYEESLMESVIAYDASVHGYRRERAVTLTCIEQDSRTIVALKAGDSTVCGYGSIRGNVQSTALLGPVYADSSSVAEMILSDLIRSFPEAQERGVTFTAQSNNPGSVEAAKKMGLRYQMECPRCYTEKDVEADYSKIYVHHSLNFSTF